MLEFVTYCRLKNVIVGSDSRDCFLMEARVVLDSDGMDGNVAIFDDWSATNPSPRTFISQLFSKDHVPRPILDSKDDDSPSSSITMECEKKMRPISFQEEGKKMGLNCTRDFSSELLGSNVQKSCLKDVQSERKAAMAGLNLLKVNTSRSDNENIMSEVNSSQNGTKNLISSFPGECSSCMLPFPSVSSTSKVVSTIDQERTLPNSNASVQENVKLLESSERKENTQDIVADQKASHSLSVNEIPPSPQPLDDHQNRETGLEVEFSSVPESDPTKDGYNWRKYGQKQLKGCEFPCSYHKCSHPSCPVKKKVERSLQGHITEIVYKGSHNHPKPPPNYRSTNPSSKQLHVPQTDSSDHPGPAAKFKENCSLASTQDGFTGPEGRDDLGGSSLCDPSNFLKSSRLEKLEATDASCPIFNDKEENGEPHGSFSEELDIEEEEMESKRRKQELCSIGKMDTSRAMVEPRIAVQIPCEFDLPDDGYRWRKYGQKVVKGNPNPRSYYKCTHRGCSVRKHVERASDDLKSVISTYEGKHNHNVPSARNINRPRNPPPKPTSTAVGLQLPSLYSRPDLAQDSFMRLESRIPMSAVNLLNRGLQLGSPTSFSFGCGGDIGQSNLASLYPSGLGSMGSFKMPFFSQMHQQMDRQINGGNVIPKREPKDEPM